LVLVKVLVVVVVVVHVVEVLVKGMHGLAVEHSSERAPDAGTAPARLPARKRPAMSA